MRVAVIGARRRRQGLGPFVARGLAAAGAEVVACVGTSAETVALAREDLRQLAGLDVAGYTDADQLLAAERLDALAILSPAGTHLPWLERALDAGLHALCEKPLVWERPDALDQARRLVPAFAERGLVLRENCQWPYTLPAFDALHPGLREAGPPSRFSMRLAPASPGPTMIGDALPHAISLLQELAPAAEARLTDIRYSSHAADAEELELAFSWQADHGPVAAEVALRLGPSQPREAGFGVDGHGARRLIRQADYAQFFADGARLVDVPDPLPLLLADFVSACRSPSHEDSAVAAHKMVERMSALHQLRAAHGAGDP